MATWTKEADLGHHASVWNCSDGQGKIYYLGKSAGIDEPDIVQMYDTSAMTTTLIGDPTDVDEFDNSVEFGPGQNVFTRLGGQGEADGYGIVQWKDNVYLSVDISFGQGILD